MRPEASEEKPEQFFDDSWVRKVDKEVFFKKSTRADATVARDDLNQDAALRAPRNPLRVMFHAVGACDQPVHSGAHGLRSHRLRSLLSVFASFVGLGLV